MQYCYNCQVHIQGNKKECPLCRNILPDDVSNSGQKEVFPDIPPSYERHLAIRIMAMISIIIIVVSFAIDTILPSSLNRPIFVVFGLVSMWLSLIVVIRKRHNITKNIMWQVTIVSILSIIWDRGTGWMGWSLDYVIPTVYVVAMLVMYVAAKIMKLSIRDYITYLLIDALFGIVPVLFILFDWISVFYPSVICVAFSFIFLSAIFIFQGENIKIELDKRMHI